jgi:hypothetical protein
MPEPTMRIRGIVQTATLGENPPGSDRIEMILRVQGVGPGQPRTLIVPYELLLADPDLDPEVVQGKRFEAEAEADEAAPRRWVVGEIAFATGHFLRKPEEP